MTPDERMTFLAHGFLVRDQMSPEVLVRWRTEFHSEVEARGGVVDDRRYEKAIANEVLREVVQRASRIFRNELVPRVREYMVEDQVEALETELSGALARTLGEIKD